MVRQYVGARYVPKFADPVAWASGTSYEAMTIVTYNNSSYTSKMPVPATVGDPADNPDYWALTGNYNAQVEQYRQETETVSNNLTTLHGQITTEITNRKNADTTLQGQITTVSNNLTTEITNRETADTTLQGNINSEAATRASADSKLQSQINQIIAPSGEAPSAAEVQNARIGADGVTYDTLGTAIRGQVTNLNSLLNEGVEVYKSFAIQAQNFKFDVSNPRNGITVEFETYNNKAIGYFHQVHNEVTVYADKNGEETDANKFRFTIPRYSCLVFTIHESTNTQAKIKPYAELTPNDIILFGNNYAGDDLSTIYIGILWEKYLFDQTYKTKQKTNDLEQIAANYTHEAPLYCSETVPFTASQNLNKDVAKIDVNISSGMTIYAKIDIVGTPPSNMQIRSRGTYITSTKRYNEWFAIPIESNINQINITVFDNYFINDFSAVFSIATSGAIRDIYNNRDAIDTKTNLEQFQSAAVEVDINHNTNQNICIIEGLNIKEGDSFFAMLKINGAFPRTSQLKQRSAYITSIKNVYNKWIEITATTDIQSIGVYFADDYVIDSFSAQLLIAINNAKEIHKNTVARLKNDASYNLPSYYSQSWLDGLKNQMDNYNKTIVNGFSFAFVTDLHFLANCGNSKYLLKHYLDEHCFPIVISGGDYAYAYGTQNQVEKDILNLKEYQEYIGDKFFQVRGNHDFTIKTSSTENTGFTAPYPVTYNRLMRPSEHLIVEGMPDHMCYYIENRVQKVRIVCLNTSDGQSDNTATPFGVYYRVTDEQIDWILNNALNVESYKIIFVHHIPLDSSLDGYDSSTLELFKIAKALKNKEIYVHGSATKDFSRTTNEFIASISGHCHSDQSVTTNGVLSITTTSDGLFQDDGYGRQKDTISEQAFDVFYFDFDRKQINTVRVGAGANREWTYE